MFLRKRGRRFLVLHSYRDGRGKVCHRRLGHFCDRAGMDRLLVQLPERFPRPVDELTRLREQAEAELGESAEGASGERGWGGVGVRAASERAERLRRATRALLTMLAEEDDPQVLDSLRGDLDELGTRIGAPARERIEEQLAEADLQLAEGKLDEAERGFRELVQVTRSRLPPRRRRLDPSEPEVANYLRSVERLHEILEKKGRLAEGAEVVAEAVERCPTPQGRLTYGWLLQRLGRPQQALEQYARVPMREAERHYNSASACWQSGDYDEALVHLLRGLTRAPQVVEALGRMAKGKQVWRGDHYWRLYGDVWPQAARRFVLAIASQHLVRHNLRLAREKPGQVRNLVLAHSRVWLLERGLAGAQGG